MKIKSYLSDVFSLTGQSLIELFINREAITLERVQECMDLHVKASAEDLTLVLDGKNEHNRSNAVR